jgi:hypothetical protein
LVDTTMDGVSWLRKQVEQAHTDLLREMVGVLAERLMVRMTLCSYTTLADVAGRFGRRRIPSRSATVILFPSEGLRAALSLQRVPGRRARVRDGGTSRTAW